MHDRHIGGWQLAAERCTKALHLARDGGQPAGLAAAGEQYIQAWRCTFMAKQLVLAGPECTDPVSLSCRKAVADQQQSCTLAWGYLAEGQRHGALGGTPLFGHDGRTQVGQQQRYGLMIPGGRHGEVGITGKQNKGDGAPLFVREGLGQHILQQQAHPGCPVRQQIGGQHGAGEIQQPDVEGGGCNGLALLA